MFCLFCFCFFCVLSPNTFKMSPALLLGQGLVSEKCHGLLSFVLGKTLSIPFCESSMALFLNKQYVDDVISNKHQSLHLLNSLF